MLSPITRPDLPADLKTAMLRGALGDCPRCGGARLFRGFLKPVESCAACHQDWTHQQADDFPPYVSIFITGHALVPLMIALGSNESLSLTTLVTIGVVVSCAMVLALLRPAKGAIIALQWWNGMHGFIPAGRDECAPAPAEQQPAGPWG